MTFLEKLDTIDRLDQLIRLKATGTPQKLGNKLGTSRRTVFDLINLMKLMGGPIKYCSYSQSYYYEYECQLAIGFVDQNKIRGGLNVERNKNLWSAKKLHLLSLSLHYSHDLGTL